MAHPLLLKRMPHWRPARHVCSIRAEGARARTCSSFSHLSGLAARQCTVNASADAVVSYPALPQPVRQLKQSLLELAARLLA